MTERGQGVLVVIIALALGLFAFIAIYGMNAGQNRELANTVAESIEQTMEDTYVETRDHAVKRHGPIVHDAINFCNEGGSNIQARMHWDSPKGPRDALICFFPTDSSWWVVVKGKEINGDDVVTAFPRRTAKALQDVIDYLRTIGYQ